MKTQIPLTITPKHGSVVGVGATVVVVVVISVVVVTSTVVEVDASVLDGVFGGLAAVDVGDGSVVVVVDGSQNGRWWRRRSATAAVCA